MKQSHITKLSDLKLDAKNANKGTDRGRKLLKKSLKELGIIPDSVIRIPPASGEDLGHPAMFSVPFADFMIRTWSQKGGIVYEPFAGAATTIIASEKADRICFGMEIEPKYVAVALERMADMGLKPKLAKRSGR
jgi:DNA modification methylase